MGARRKQGQGGELGLSKPIYRHHRPWLHRGKRYHYPREALGADYGSFDVVVSCNMFHYIRRPVAALHEMGRVLRPGGELVITDWCDDYLACRVCDWYLRLFSPAHFKVYREREYLHLLKEVGHPRADIDCYRISWLWGLMTAKVTKDAA